MFAVVVVACAFPDVTFGPQPDVEAGPPDVLSGDSESDSDSDGDTASADGSTVGDAEADVLPILIDGSTLDALIVIDGGGKVDATGCTSCDCDDDNYNDLGKQGCAGAGGQPDCDDKDSRTHPQQGFLFDNAEPPRNGDWDCSGKVEKLYTNEKTTCAGLTLGLGCSDIFGFTGPVACGQKGEWIRCMKRPGLLTLDCVVGEQRLETQLCK
jgi:hypothetical protein